MRKLPAGLGLAFLALAVAASVPVGGCRGESPVRVVQSHSTGTGTTGEMQDAIVVEPIEVPKELQKPFEGYIQGHFDSVLGESIADLERPIRSFENRFGLKRLSIRMRVGDHNIDVVPSNAALIGNRTDPISPDTWEPKLFLGMTGRKADAESEKQRFSQYAKEALPYFATGYRDPIRWRTDVGMMEARPVILKNEQCLTCHTKNEVGDVAGIVIARLSHESAEKIIELNSKINRARVSHADTSSPERSVLISR